MPFFSTHNLTSQAVVECAPWEFVLVAPISAQVRGDKISRQEFYQSASTSHNFYTAVEAHNPNARVSKQNPPRLLHGVVADYDLPVPEARWREVVATMKHPPQYAERSLGGNLRLVWIFSKPIPVGSADFATFVLGAARQFFMLDLLPGLDAPALTDSARLFCNGCEWTQVSPQPVPELAVQSFFVQCGKKYAFKDTAEECAIPLDVVERALAVKHPTFSWPGSFELDSAGPSFFVEGSTSPTSALVKATGMFSFAAHAQKCFFSWSDLLGPDFASQWQADSIAAATRETWFDGHDYWKFNETEGRYVNMSKDALTIHFRVNCRVSDKKDKSSGVSALDRCLSHVNDYQRVAGAGPVLFQPVGKLRCCGQWIVNTAPKSSVVQPSGAADPKFPFLDSLLSSIFDPAAQKWQLLAWLKFFYLGALNQNPGPGQALFLAGGVGIGKTLLNRHVIGELVGGHADASQFLLGNSPFNSHLFESPTWAMDDSSPADSDAAHRTFSSCIKAITANQTFTYNKKFQVNFMISWSGRVIVTLNLTEASRRALVALDDSIADKVSLFKCAATPTVVFPARDKLREIIKSELPHLAQWLVDWKVPEEFVGDSRYGVRSWHEPSLLDSARQASRSAPFSELMIEFLSEFFKDNPAAKDWSASTTQIMRAISSNPLNEHALRSLRLDQLNRHLEALAKDGGIECVSASGKHGIRIWKFSRF